MPEYRVYVRRDEYTGQDLIILDIGHYCSDFILARIVPDVGLVIEPASSRPFDDAAIRKFIPLTSAGRIPEFLEDR